MYRWQRLGMDNGMFESLLGWTAIAASSVGLVVEIFALLVATRMKKMTVKFKTGEVLDINYKGATPEQIKKIFEVITKIETGKTGGLNGES